MSRPIVKKIRDQLFYLIILLIYRTITLMPRRPVLKCAAAIGATVFCFKGGMRKRTVANIRRALGHDRQETVRIARGVFRHFLIAAFDLMFIPRLSRSGRIKKIVSAHGMEHLDRAFAAGRGVMMLTGHFGNWEILGAWLAANGYPRKVIGRPLFNPGLDRLLVGIRNQAGYTNIARGESSREIIRTIKAKGAIGMLIDQDVQVQGVFAPFFGRKAFTPTGPVVLARRFSIPIVPIFCRMNPDFTYEITCHPEIEQGKEKDDQAEITATTSRINHLYEEVIGSAPEQWVWMHKRWKTRPESE